MRGAPVLTVTTIVTVGLGIGTTTAVFSLIYTLIWTLIWAAMLRSLPVDVRAVSIKSAPAESADTRAGHSIFNLFEY
ncbi:MAG TPA: hypothetical protein VH139_05810 [Acidobacteriaceae bacterium]|jgi:hypothetical protein|nr:hypothetical protein [Acidobacteriaceae bacterium]